MCICIFKEAGTNSLKEALLSPVYTEKVKLSHEEGDIFNVTLQLSQQDEGLLSLPSYFTSHM